MRFRNKQSDIPNEEIEEYGEYPDDSSCADETETYDGEQCAEAAAPAKKRRRTKLEKAINIVLWIAIVVLAVIVALRMFVYNSVEVSGISMTPTYDSGEVVVVNKVVKPKRGDVAVFYLNDVDSKLKAMFAKAEECGEGQPYEKLIKRVVAVEGDKLWATKISTSGVDEIYQVIVQTADGKRYCEDYYVKKGEKLEQSVYYIHTVAPTGLGILEQYSESNPYTVSKNCFFAMGDHRSNSRDSREFGEFPLSRLFGVVLDK